MQDSFSDSSRQAVQVSHKPSPSQAESKTAHVRAESQVQNLGLESGHKSKSGLNQGTEQTVLGPLPTNLEGITNREIGLN